MQGIRRRIGFGVLGISMSIYASTVSAQNINVGVVLSTTGPGSAVGIATRNVLPLWPSEIAGHPLNVIVRDDRSDSAAATTLARRLATDDRVDVLIGSSLTPGNVAVSAVASETQTPHMTLAPIVTTVEKSPWTFNVPSTTPNMALKLFEEFKPRGISKVGYIGFSDVWGDQWVSALNEWKAKNPIQIVGEERFARSDTSVAGQALRLISLKPDAIVVGASSSAAGMVHRQLRELGFDKPIFHTHGAVTADFSRIAGKTGEGAIAPSGLSAVAEDLPDNSPNKKPAMAFIKDLEEKHGFWSRTTFAAQLYDAGIILQAAIPVALKKAKPGTPEFRVALKEAIESIKDLPGSQALFSYSPKDHNGTDLRSAVIVVVKDGTWRLMR